MSAESVVNPPETEGHDGEGESGEDGCFVPLEGPITVGRLVTQDLAVAGEAGPDGGVVGWGTLSASGARGAVTADVVDDAAGGIDEAAG